MIAIPSKVTDPLVSVSDPVRKVTAGETCWLKAQFQPPCRVMSFPEAKSSASTAWFEANVLIVNEFDKVWVYASFIDANEALPTMAFVLTAQVVKLAVQVLFAPIVTCPLPSQSPPHPVKLDNPPTTSGIAVRETRALYAKGPEQVEPQLMAPGAEYTVPAPTLVTVS